MCPGSTLDGSKLCSSAEAERGLGTLTFLIETYAGILGVL